MRRQWAKTRESLHSVFSTEPNDRLSPSKSSLVDQHDWTNSKDNGDSQRRSSSSNSKNRVGSSPTPISLLDAVKIQKYERQLLETIAEGKLSEADDLLAYIPKLSSVNDDYGKTPLHIAAEFNHIKIVDRLISRGHELDIADVEGNTPLHLAVLKDNKEVVERLIYSGADTTISNYDMKAPIHVACFNNCQESLKVILQLRPESKELKGERGYLPGHYCALGDSPEAFQILVDMDKLVCGGDYTGSYPIHLAIKNLSSKFLNAMVDVIKSKCGMDPALLMNMKDLEGNGALHIAVNTGDERSVQLCLDYDADIGSQQSDNSTPLHYACTKGELDFVRLMMLKQMDNFKRVLRVRDNNGFTPLHNAAFFGHADVCRFLVEQGADMEAADNYHRTALLLAAYKNSLNVCDVLIELGADCTKADINGRNVFHLLVLGSGASCDRFKAIPKFAHLKRLVNEKDIFGCSPLHYATRKGLISSTHAFLKMGADCFVQNNNEDTPLHFAARYGRINTCRKLLDSGNSGRVLNCMDSKGYLPLHAAAENGHTRIMTLLLDRGSIFQKTFEGDSPLNLAAKNGHLETVEYLLTINPSLLNSTNNHGKSALHLAADEGKWDVVQFLLTSGADILIDNDHKTFINLAIDKRHVDVVRGSIGHERWQEILLTCHTSQVRVECPVGRCLEELPNMAELAFDRCCLESGDRNEPDYEICYDFAILSGRSIEQHLQIPPLAIFKMMVNLNRVDLLQHPVCEGYLNYKWLSYGRCIHFFNMSFYFAFVVFLTMYSLYLEPQNHTDPMSNCSTEYGHPMFQKFCVMVLMAMIGVSVIKEFVQMYQQGRRYITDVSNYFEWALYICVTIGIMPTFLMTSPQHFQYEAVAIAMLLGYLNLLLFFKRFDMFGIYVVMFLEISQTLFKALLLFIILIIGFSFSFYVLLRYPFDKAANGTLSTCFAGTNETVTNSALLAWRTPQMAFAKTAMMMMGEFDYLATFVTTSSDNNDLTNHFSILTYILLFLFIFFIPILLMNLLIGLAVGDIESVRKDAVLKRIAMQVDWYSELEEKMPIFLRKTLFTKTWVFYPNCCIRNGLYSYVTLIKAFCKCGKTAKQIEFDSDDQGDVDWSRLRTPAFVQDRIQKNRCEQRMDRNFQRQNDRMNMLENQMESQTKLLKLIMQKMDIHTESEEKDEGMALSCQEDTLICPQWKKLTAIKKLRCIGQLTQGRPKTASSVSTTSV